MKYEDYLDIFKQAILSPYGIILQYNQKHVSQYARQRLYCLRENLRRKGDYQYDGLSMLVTYEGDLKIIKRKLVSKMLCDELGKPHIDILNKFALPDSVGSRGRATRKNTD